MDEPFTFKGEAISPLPPKKTKHFINAKHGFLTDYDYIIGIFKLFLHKR